MIKITIVIIPIKLIKGFHWAKILSNNKGKNTGKWGPNTMIERERSEAGVAKERDI